MPKRISDSKKLEGTGFWGRLHTKDHSGDLPNFLG